ncbi:MAG: hypothetical protein Q8L75_15925 [Acidobacteriota bacterium]|nr:hypothetical protein [Acidobacteriota bacterium]
MELHLAPEMVKKLTDLAATTGRRADDLVQDALSGYLEELGSLRETLGSRYDDLKDGRVEAVDGDEARRRLRERSDQRRA